MPALAPEPRHPVPCVGGAPEEMTFILPRWHVQVQFGWISAPHPSLQVQFRRIFATLPSMRTLTKGTVLSTASSLNSHLPRQHGWIGTHGYLSANGCANRMWPRHLPRPMQSPRETRKRGHHDRHARANGKSQGKRDHQTPLISQSGPKKKRSARRDDNRPSNNAGR